MPQKGNHSVPPFFIVLALLVVATVQPPVASRQPGLGATNRGAFRRAKAKYDGVCSHLMLGKPTNHFVVIPIDYIPPGSKYTEYKYREIKICPWYYRKLMGLEVLACTVDGTGSVLVFNSSKAVFIYTADGSPITVRARGYCH